MRNVLPEFNEIVLETEYATPDLNTQLINKDELENWFIQLHEQKIVQNERKVLLEEAMNEDESNWGIIDR